MFGNKILIMKPTKLFYTIFIITVLFFGSVTTTFAKKTLGDAESALGQVVAPTGLSEGNINYYIAGVVEVLFLTIGLVFFILMVYAGVRWFTSRGEEEYVNKARKTLIGSVIGIIIVTSGYALSTFVTSRISGGATEIDTLPNAADVTPSGAGQVCCIVPATSNIGSPYTASIRDPQQCWDFAVEAYPSSAGEAVTLAASREKGDGWEMYEAVNNLSKCLEIFKCWDEVHLQSGFDECMSKFDSILK